MQNTKMVTLVRDTALAELENGLVTGHERAWQNGVVSALSWVLGAADDDETLFFALIERANRTLVL